MLAPNTACIPRTSTINYLLANSMWMHQHMWLTSTHSANECRRTHKKKSHSQSQLFQFEIAPQTMQSENNNFIRREYFLFCQSNMQQLTTHDDAACIAKWGKQSLMEQRNKHELMSTRYFPSIADMKRWTGFPIAFPSIVSAVLLSEIKLTKTGVFRAKARDLLVSSANLEQIFFSEVCAPNEKCL